jgi:polyhydroxyalkanoate synthesis regulator protein
MPVLTVQVDDETLAVLQSIALENGNESVDRFLATQALRLAKSYRGNGVSSELPRHLRDSLAENQQLLERLAQ